MKEDLKSYYKETVVPALKKELSYTNVESIPKLKKISVNRGLGDLSKNTKEMNASIDELTLITGQKAVLNNAKQSIAGFKIREGMTVGTSVTLRSEKMYNFYNKLVNIVLPRIKDFQGIPTKGFDGRGNYTFGITDQLIFPEISYDDVKEISGMSITITTTASTDNEALALLTKLGMPFKK